ncbi:hypothetical protein RI129_011978 [Pyrocoelia pectoralis]|uniref:Mutator-like transposase domain-containing protein n=1 Tax=Pyrocoelia pectoralis TaxID=417401 RepID=A0AAN7ZGC3_9COLE
MEELPELHVERSTVFPSNLHGNRLVEIAYFVEQSRRLGIHDAKCTMGKMEFQHESRNGLLSYFTYFCQTCENEIKIKTHHGDDVNENFVWGGSAIGLGYSQSEELLSVLNVPVMTKKTYKKLEMGLHDKWQQLLAKDMQESAEEEKKLAIEAGNVEDSFPYITVVVDGGWAKRSYGHSYSSLSGEKVSYGRSVIKLECANHCVRAYTAALHRLIKNRQFQIESRNILKKHVGKISSCTRKVIAKSSDLLNMKMQLKDSFAVARDNVIRKADRLLRNVTTNPAERYMSIVSKFTGGKRTNLVMKNMYLTRCAGAALSYNIGHQAKPVVAIVFQNKRQPNILLKNKRKHIYVNILNIF